MSMCFSDNGDVDGTARNLEIDRNDMTLELLLFGWALQMPRADVQPVTRLFSTELASQLVANWGTLTPRSPRLNAQI